MFKICSLCETKKAGKPRLISFNYRKLKFDVFKDDSICSFCERKHVKEMYEEFCREFVWAQNGKIMINWKLYLKSCRDTDGESIRENYTQILLYLGIVSFEAKGNWEIVTNAANILNPRLGPAFSAVYFTRQEDVLAYARVIFDRDRFGWEIRKVMEVLKPSDVFN